MPSCVFAVIACDKREAFVQGSASDEAIHPMLVIPDGAYGSAQSAAR